MVRRRLRRRDSLPIALSLMLGGAMCGAAGDAEARSLYADIKAAKVGDTVTIIVDESTQASRSASTKTSRTSGVSVNGGFANRSAGTNTSTSMDGGFTGGAEHNGTGVTRSSGTLTTIVTAIVTEVQANGLLKVEGTRQLQINEEKATLTVTGLLRPVDISRTNSVLSTQLANPVISYTGEGWINKQQKPNLLVRILTSILPFF